MVNNIPQLFIALIGHYYSSEAPKKLRIFSDLLVGLNDMTPNNNNKFRVNSGAMNDNNPSITTTTTAQPQDHHDSSNTITTTTTTSSSSTSSPIIYSSNPYDGGVTATTTTTTTTPNIATRINNHNDDEAFIELEEYSLPSRPSTHCVGGEEEYHHNDHDVPLDSSTLSTPLRLDDDDGAVPNLASTTQLDDSSQLYMMNTKGNSSKNSAATTTTTTRSSNTSSSSSSTSSHHHDVVTLTKEEYELLKQLERENEELRKMIHSNNNNTFTKEPLVSSENAVKKPSIIQSCSTTTTTTNTTSTTHSNNNMESNTIIPNTITTTLTYRSHVKNATNHDEDMNDEREVMMANKYFNIPSNNDHPSTISFTPLHHASNMTMDTTEQHKNHSSTTEQHKKHSSSHHSIHESWSVQQFKKLIISLIFLYWTYLSHNFREIRKRKLAYLLGVGSCVVVVFVVCVSLTVLQQVPIIFLRLAENNKFEADMVITPSNAISSTTAFNLTAMEENIIRATGQEDYTLKYSYHSPRIELSSLNIYSSSSCKTENSNNGLSLPSYIDSFDDMDKISWFYNGIVNSSTNTCRKSSSFCVPKFCTQVVKSNLYILDLERERRMEFGRSFSYPLLSKNEAYVSSVMASNLNLKVGDTFIIQLNTREVLNGPFREAQVISDPSNSTLVDKILKFNSFFSFRVKDILPHNFRKMEYTVKDFIFIEYKYFLHSIAPYLNPNQYSKESLMNLTRVNMDHYAKTIYWNLAPSRIQKYNLQQYTDVRALVVNFASSLSYYIGFDQISQSYPVLQFLNSLRFVSLFLSLIINVIITILTLLSTVLIYSLLMINVENRTFEMGVLRMIGMHRKGLIQLIIIQAFLYSIPGLVLGLVLGGASYVGVSYLLGHFFDTR